MMIEFLCPNGHRIRCPEQRAGQAAKCPKCGVKFRIPVPDFSEEESSDEPATVPGIGDQASGSGRLPAGPAAEPQIEFLCPNGHRLHGPASLQGRPGQCPECGSRFRIPSYDEVPDEEEEQAEEIGLVGAGSGTKVTFEDSEESEAQGPGFPPGEPVTTALRLEDSGPMAGATKALSPAELLAKIWTEKTSDTIVELHLTSGEKLTPYHFAPTASLGSHGLFAVEDSDRYTLMLVAWDSIARIEIRGVKRLPDWMQK